MNLQRKKQIIHTLIAGFMIVGLSINHVILAQPKQAHLSQTQSQLAQLNKQIKNLQDHLTTAHDKRGLLNKELANTEKLMGDSIRQLHLMHQDITTKEQKIAELHHKMTQLNNQLTTQQQLLSHQVRARYQIGEYQPLKWLLNQDYPLQISRLLTYYQYIIQSRQQLIAQIDGTQKHLNENKRSLDKELAATQKLKAQLSEHQQQLEQNKIYHTNLIQSLNNEIQDKQNTLLEFQKNKENLSRLLLSLSQESRQQSKLSFVQMRKKLPSPIQSKQRSLQSMNQGVTFFADEGTIVTAVYPGKVVFSDWLKGYGLLIIIDHGQGFMTLYAHNQSLFKKKGDTVQQQEQIASVGHSGGIQQNGLYFEIRLGGKAVPPLNWLS